MWNYLEPRTGPVLDTDVQTTPPLPLKKWGFHFFVRIVAQCSETYEKSIFIFRVMIYSIHNLQVFLSTINGRKKCLKRCAMFWNRISRFFRAIFSSWNMVNFVFNSELGIEILANLIQTLTSKIGDTI